MPPQLVPQYGWPPYLVTKLAGAYVGKSRWHIYRAVHLGHLAPAGKRGRELVFAREDLDRYMLGVGSEPTEATPGPRRTIASAPSSDALARLRAIKAGSR
jgi:hypothetical protein